MISTVRASIVSLCITAAALSGCQSGDGSDSLATTGNSSTTTADTTTSASVTISWQTPSTNVNGSALTNLAGYHIHYGTDSYALTSEIAVPIGLTDYVLTELQANHTYYFAISSYNTQGIESSNSPVVSVTTG
jgi:Fibronectin type III domain